MPISDNPSISTYYNIHVSIDKELRERFLAFLFRHQASSRDIRFNKIIFYFI
jgi:hypothetical protein